MFNNRVKLASFGFLLLSTCLTSVSSQGLLGGFKGHNHRGTGAVELLLATGILAKLLNHRAKHGPSYAGRHILHALLGPRYPPRFGGAGRYPLESQQGLFQAQQGLLQEDLLEQHASVGLPLQDELMLNQESALLGAKSPYLINPSLPLLATDSQLLAEAQISQQLLAARRARKILEARKLLAAQQAQKMFAAQSEAAHIFAAQEAAQAATYLQATPSRQVITTAPAPPRMLAQKMNGMQMKGMQMNGMQMNGMQMNAMPMNGMQMNGMQMNKGSSQGQDQMMMGSERNVVSRSDSQLYALPPGLSEQETAQIIADIAELDRK